MQLTDATIEDVPSGQQGLGRPVAESVDLLVDRRVFLDVEVDLGNVRLGLVVVVVADEVLDGVVGEQGAELAHQLGGEGLVRAHDEGRPLEAGDRVRHREGLAAARDPEQRDVLLPLLDPTDDLLDRLRLVSLGQEVRLELEATGELGPGWDRRAVSRHWAARPPAADPR